jgi:hypothetical protein
MATNNPNDPYDRNHLKDPTRTYIGDRRSPAEIDNELQSDPEMAEGPASSSRVVLFAIGIAVILGLVFYAVNNTSIQQASTVPTPANQSTPASPPRANTQPGTTTGAAPANPQAPSPASTAPGGANTNNANPGNASK